MLRKIFAMSITLALFGSLVAQEKPIVLRQVDITPKPGMASKLEKGLLDHNKKFHVDAGHPVITWQVLSGPNTGTLIRSTPLVNWEYFDDSNDPPEDQVHWDRYVSPYVESTSGQYYNRFFPNLSSKPVSADGIPKMLRVMSVDVEKGAWSNIFDLFEKAQQARDKTGSSQNVWVIRTIEGGERRYLTTLFGMDKWADRNPQEKPLSERMDEAFGKGSWEKWVEEWREIVIERKVETWLYRPDLSSMN